MSAAPTLFDTLHSLPPRLRAELLRHLICTAEARAEERARLRPDPIMAAWVELLDELESGGPLMREVVRDSLESEPHREGPKKVPAELPNKRIFNA